MVASEDRGRGKTKAKHKEEELKSQNSFPFSALVSTLVGDGYKD